MQLQRQPASVAAGEKTGATMSHFDAVSVLGRVRQARDAGAGALSKREWPSIVSRKTRLGATVAISLINNSLMLDF
jgi:hypothetical protein